LLYPEPHLLTGLAFQLKVSKDAENVRDACVLLALQLSPFGMIT
jgi:hypothetical protein